MTSNTAKTAVLAAVLASVFRRWGEDGRKGERGKGKRWVLAGGNIEGKGKHQSGDGRGGGGEGEEVGC